MYRLELQLLSLAGADPKSKAPIPHMVIPFFDVGSCPAMTTFRDGEWAHFQADVGDVT